MVWYMETCNLIKLKIMLDFVAIMLFITLIDIVHYVFLSC